MMYSTYIAKSRDAAGSDNPPRVEAPHPSTPGTQLPQRSNFLSGAIRRFPIINISSPFIAQKQPFVLKLTSTVICFKNGDDNDEISALY
eukprot:scaffold4735_cov104-Skeletonema_dohrnii-CCMP3373.AAC.3